ncbi:MAG: thiol reductase thioredoxin [Verrucomicrobiaceae bacterium]|nr:thiol reductase thioredoxin [Verrucomicrobiaceae bacterium]
MAMTKQFAAIEPTRNEIDALSGLVVLEFGTPWCGYCQAAQPIIEQAFSHLSALQLSTLRHLKVEDGSGRPLGRSFRVKLWPTLIFLRNGEEILRLVRPTDSDSIRIAFEQLQH